MKKHLSIIYYFLITIGVIGVIVSLGYDFFRPGEPDFGRKQFIGFIGSVLILFSGLRRSPNTQNNFWDFVSLLIYIAGMFYLVLIARHNSHNSTTGMLESTGFYVVDFGLNVIGFMPLGYLLMSLFTKFTGKHRQTITFLVILFIGVLLSFLIEIGQYFVPGRTSSLVDVAANGLGNLFGILLFLLGSSFSKKES